MSIDLSEEAESGRPQSAKGRALHGGVLMIPLNAAALDALVKWACRYPSPDPIYDLFPWADNWQVDPTRPTNGWRTAGEKA